MKIRSYCNNDILGICSLFKTELGYYVSERELQTRIEKMLNSKTYLIYVATEVENIIGFIGLQICLTFEAGNIMRIIALAVSKDFQGRGIGSALVQTAENYANENHISTLAVNSGLNRAKAHQFYEHKAFYRKGYSFCKQLN